MPTTPPFTSSFTTMEQKDKRELSEHFKRAMYKQKKFEQEKYLHDAEYYDADDEEDEY